MYKIIKNVIQSKNYELVDILKKIDTMWVQGSITEENRNELIQLARENANPENSYSSLENKFYELYQKVEMLTKNQEHNALMIQSLKESIEALGGTVTGPEEPEEPTEEYPLYKQPTGAHDAYYNGDKMTYTDGFKYVCIAPEGTPCVWSPDDYPSYWQKVEDEVEALN